VAQQIVERHAGADGGGEMHDDVDAREGRRDRLEVGDVGLVRDDAGHGTSTQSPDVVGGALAGEERASDEPAQARDQHDRPRHTIASQA